MPASRSDAASNDAMSRADSQAKARTESPAVAPGANRTRDILVATAGLSGAIGVVLSATVVNVGVPSIMGAFGIGQNIAQWAATAFLATMVASQLLNTWVVRTLGQRGAYSLTLIVFTIGTFISALAPGIEVLIIGRILQGFAAGVILPMVLATMVSVFPVEKRGLAVGIYGMAVTMAPSFGPIVGGITIDALTWRHIFFVPMPLIFVAFILGTIYMPGKSADDPPPPKIDWSGLFLMVIALFSLMTGLANGQRWGWETSEIMMLLSIGIGASVLFVVVQLKSKNPLLDLTLFRNSTFSAAMFIAFLFGAGNFATNYAIPVFVQTIQGYSATLAGLVLVPAGLLLILMSPLTGRLADGMPAHIPITIGVIVFSVASYFMVDSDVNTAFWSLALLTVLSRIGIGLVMPNMGAAAMRPIPTEKLNAGAGAYNFIRQLGGSFGVLFYVVVTEQRTAFHADALSATQTSGNQLSLDLMDKVARLLQESGIPDAMQDAVALDFLSQVIQAQASTFGFQDGFMTVALVFLCALVPAWMLRRAAKQVV